MKFTITSITEEGVKAKEDNPIPEPIFPNEALGPDPRLAKFKNDLNKWRLAEANRKEYDVISEYAGMIFCDESTTVGSRIEGDIINNEIVNVKLI